MASLQFTCINFFHFFHRKSIQQDYIWCFYMTITGISPGKGPHKYGIYMIFVGFLEGWACGVFLWFLWYWVVELMRRKKRLHGFSPVKTLKNVFADIALWFQSSTKKKYKTEMNKPFMLFLEAPTYATILWKHK